MIDVFLMPGEYFVGTAGYRIRTLLGSCVSITLWHPALRIGAMSHFLLAARHRRDDAQRDGRYGEEALELMIEELARLGARASECEARLFGGATLFPALGDGGIGRQNGEVALALLHRHGILLRSECLFGMGHRRIVFDLATGEATSTLAQLREQRPHYLGRTAQTRALGRHDEGTIQQFGMGRDGVQQDIVA